MVNAGKWKNDWRSEYYLNTSNNENGGEEPNGITNLQDDAQLIENFSQRISGFSANVNFRSYITLLLLLLLFFQSYVIDLAKKE